MDLSAAYPAGNGRPAIAYQNTGLSAAYPAGKIIVRSTTPSCFSQPPITGEFRKILHRAARQSLSRLSRRGIKGEYLIDVLELSQPPIRRGMPDSSSPRYWWFSQPPIRRGIRQRDIHHLDVVSQPPIRRGICRWLPGAPRDFSQPPIRRGMTVQRSLVRV